jgi:hypothetical protein
MIEETNLLAKADLKVNEKGLTKDCFRIWLDLNPWVRVMILKSLNCLSWSIDDKRIPAELL